MTHSRSSRIFGVGIVALLVLPLTLGSLRMAGRVIVPDGDVVTEDLYAMGELVIIEGTVEGDVFAVAGEVRVTGTVTGDVIALVGGPLVVSGTVGGAVRAAAVTVDLPGRVADDALLAALEATLGGSVGRDVIMVAGETSLGGRVGRDLLAQSVRMKIDGVVGRDVEVRVDTLSLGSRAQVEGDLLYQASADAGTADGAVVAGQFTRRDVLAPVWAKAVTRMVSFLSLLGLIVAGLVGAWLFRSTSAAALDEVAEHPWRSAAVGVGVLLVVPVLLVPLFLTLVGIPVALLLLVAWIVALVLGPIPAVTRAGTFIVRGRGGMAAALVVGAVAWRGAMWALPLLSGLLYLAALLVGLGAYARAGWRLRGSRAS